MVLVTMDATMPTAMTAAELNAISLMRYSAIGTPCFVFLARNYFSIAMGALVSAFFGLWYNVWFYKGMHFYDEHRITNSNTREY
jgi:hypothetical protein